MKKQNSSKSPVRYCLGIDVSKDSLSVCFSQVDAQQRVSIKGTRSFENRERGWKGLESWIARFRKDMQLPFSIVMEATGVYHEGCAYYFMNRAYVISVILPSNSKHYAKSVNQKSKTDGIDAGLLAQMGLERSLTAWQGVRPIFRQLKQLSRTIEALQEQSTVIKNQLHALLYSYESEKTIVKLHQKHLKFIETQIEILKAEMEALVERDEDLKSRMEKVCSIKGVGLFSAVTVVAEANGFDLFENKNQLVSYAGLDVIANDSGTSVKGKARISKKGNSHIRRALHYPSLTASRFEPKLEQFYKRICEKNPKTKMIGMVAVQRKLLVLIYTLYKKNEAYDPQYEAPENTKKIGGTIVSPTQHSSAEAACFVQQN